VSRFAVRTCNVVKIGCVTVIDVGVEASDDSSVDRRKGRVGRRNDKREQARNVVLMEIWLVFVSRRLEPPWVRYLRVFEQARCIYSVIRGSEE